MPFPNNMSAKEAFSAKPSLKSLESKAMWLSFLLLGIGLHVFESTLPNLGPWFKLGLANIMTLLALVMMGPRAAFCLAIARVIVGSVFIGTLLTPTFFISLAGACAAASAMLLSYKLMPRLPLISLSLLAAVAHMLTQFVVVESWFIQQTAVYYLLPPLLLLSCLSGWLTGAIAHYVYKRIRHLSPLAPQAQKSPHNQS